MKKSRILRILLALTLAAALLLTACSSGGGEEAETEDPGTEQGAEQGSEDPGTPEVRTVTVTDMSGDEVTVTGEVDSIVNLWPAGTSSFFVMGAGDLVKGLAVNKPGTMNAWTQYFYPNCVNIPALGGTTPAVEEIIKLSPDLVVIHPSTAKDGMAGQIRDGGVPAVNINFSNYETMAKAYTTLGTILGGEYEQKLATWCKEVTERSERNKNLIKDIAEEDRPVVFYIAGQSDSLVTTMGPNTIVHDWVETSGGRYAPAVMGMTGTEVTAEEIFALDPDVIIVGGVYQHSLIKQLETEAGWKDLKAVKDGRVYNNPYGCFNWDRFGLESRLQLDYALSCIQPEIAAQNGITRESLEQTVVDFYKYYNGTELTREQAGFMLDGLQPDGTAEFPAA